MNRQAYQTSGSGAVDVAQLALNVEELAARFAQLTSDVEDLSAAVLPAELSMPDLGSHSLPEPESSAPAQAAYMDLKDWVDAYFLPTFRRPIGGELRWCAQWYEHAEAVTRLEALWRSWETLRLDPNLGIATWLTNYLDPLLAALLSRIGPFAQCTPERHA